MKSFSLVALASISVLTHATSAEVPPAATTCPAPSRLSCELLLEPLRTTIYDPCPEFGWECGSGDQAFAQSAYEVVVRAVPAANSEGDIFWESGRVEGGDSLNIDYKGKPLHPGQEYTWRVRVWDVERQESDWSLPQRFRMARSLSEADISRYPVAEVPQIAETVREIENQTYLVDFGTAAFGYLKLRVPTADVTRGIRVTFGEKLNGKQIDRRPGGTIRTYNVDTSIPARTSEVVVRPPKDERNTTGDAVALPDAVGVVAPFRYVEISGLATAPEAGNVVQVRMEYPFDNEAAAFESSDPTLNSIWKLCKYSIRATTFCGVYIDGDRERIPYEADAYINQLSHYGVDREYALARYSHEYLLANPTWPTEWKQHSVLMAFADYWYTGDRESLARCYEILKRDKLLTQAERTDGLLDTSDGYRDIVDWPEEERDGHEMLPVNTVVNAFHYVTLKRMSYLAGILGREHDKKQFADKATLLKDTFNEVLWSKSTGRYVDGERSQHSSLHANLFPLAFGLVPPERRQSVVEFVKSRQMRCSVYAAQYLLEGLYRADEDQYAFELLTSHSKRSWYNMIRSGSTITLEAWDQSFKPNLDWNHAWGAAPANLIPMYLVGVRPSAPGFKRFIVQPRPGELESFSAKVPSPRGAIHVRYSRSEEVTHLDVEVPGNSLARVGIPLRDATQAISVLQNGEKTTARITGAHAWIDNVPPGKHAFQLLPVSTITQASKTDSVER